MNILLENKQQAIAFRDEMTEQIDQLLNTADDPVFFALSAVRAALVTDIRYRVAQLPSIAQYTPQETWPAVVVAHHIYANGLRESELVQRNRPAHPGFISDSVEYLK